MSLFKLVSLNKLNKLESEIKELLDSNSLIHISSINYIFQSLKYLFNTLQEDSDAYDKALSLELDYIEIVNNCNAPS